MKKFILALSLISVNSWAVGNFNGTWRGPGKITSNIGLSSTCSQIEIIIKQTDTEIGPTSYISKCTMFGSEWGPYPMTYFGTDVFADGEKVGTISDSTLLTILPSGSVSYAFNLKLVKKADGSNSLQTYYAAGNGVGAIATEGLLEKVAP